jgi:hypothetical protein
MSSPRKDLEFAVDDASGHQRTFKTFEAACGFAVSLAAGNGMPHNVDVLIYSKTAARAWGGDDGVAEYESDPEASVSDRIEIRAESKGRVY